MNDRYPYIRFVVDAAQVIAGALALIILLSGTVRACSAGGAGFWGFVVAVVFAVAAYVVVMVKLEVLRVLLDIEKSTRQAQAPPPRIEAPPAAPPPAAH